MTETDSPDRVPILTSGDRLTLERLADCLIPSTVDGPGAAQLGVGESIEVVLRMRQDLVSPLLARLREAQQAADPGSYLRSLERRDRDAFEEFVWTVVATYTMHPEVRRRLGYPGQVPREIRAGEPDDVLEALLDAPYLVSREIDADG